MLFRKLGEMESTRFDCSQYTDKRMNLFYESLCSSKYHSTGTLLAVRALAYTAGSSLAQFLSAPHWDGIITQLLKDLCGSQLHRNVKLLIFSDFADIAPTN